MQDQSKTVPVPITDGYTRFVSRMNKIIDPIAKYAGAAIGGFALATMMFLTIIDVLGRFLSGFKPIHQVFSFIQPVPGSLEMTEILLGLLVSFGLGYCALHKGHIRVDLVLQYTSKKANLWFDIFAYILAFLFCCGVVWQAWVGGMAQFENKLATANLGIPIYPFYFVLMIGAAIIALVFLRDFFVAVEEVRK